MKVEMIQRPGRTDEALAVLSVLGVILVLSCIISFIIISSRPEPPETGSLFSRGDRITIRVNGSSGIIKKVFYWSGSKGWSYEVRLAVGMGVMEFAEDELAKHAKGASE